MCSFVPASYAEAAEESSAPRLNPTVKSFLSVREFYEAWHDTRAAHLEYFNKTHKFYTDYDANMAAFAAYEPTINALNDLAGQEVDRPVALFLGGVVLGAGLAPLVPIAVGASGTTGLSALGLTVTGDGIVAGVSTMPIHSALGDTNTLGTFATDVVLGGSFSLALRGAVTLGAPLVNRLVGDGFVAAETAAISPKVALQGVTDRVVADLAATPQLARGVLSRKEYARLAEGGPTASAQYGNAVERLTADYVRRDPALGNILGYRSAPFRSTPDFLGFEGYNLRPLDITTARSVPGHTSRSYGTYTEYVLHPGVPPNLVFPR